MALRGVLWKIECAVIIAALEVEPSRERAAKWLQIDLRTLRQKIVEYKRLGIPVPLSPTEKRQQIRDAVMKEKAQASWKKSD